MVDVNTYALVSVAEAKNYLLESPVADLEQKEGLIKRLINSVSVMAESYMNRNILSREYSNEDHDGKGTDILQLDHYPIISVSSVYDDIDRNFDSAHLITSSNLIIYANQGQIKRKGTVLQINEETGRIWKSAVWAKGRLNVRTTYTAGYTTTPDDIKHAVLEEVIWHYERITRKTLGVTGVSALGEHTSVFTGDLLPTTKMILSAYRKLL